MDRSGDDGGYDKTADEQIAIKVDQTPRPPSSEPSQWPPSYAASHSAFKGKEWAFTSKSERKNGSQNEKDLVTMRGDTQGEVGS